MTESAAAATEQVTCPECGLAATVTLNRRDAVDFCRNCDFPLFWTPTAVVRERGAGAADDSLRRLPGTVGRATLASARCPHCAEPNQLTAQVCVRCGEPMLPGAPPPPPTVPVHLPPPPVVVPEPEPASRWWVWLIVVLLVAGVTLAVLAARHVI
jgi:hypothetical protein